MTTIPQKDLRGTRLSPDWQPSAMQINYAASLGLEGNVVARITEDFRDYWLAVPGQRGLKLDWMATWRTWCRREADKRGGTPPFGGGGGPRPYRESVIDIAANLSLGLRAAE